MHFDKYILCLDMILYSFEVMNVVFLDYQFEEYTRLAAVTNKLST